MPNYRDLSVRLTAASDMKRGTRRAERDYRSYAKRMQGHGKALSKTFAALAPVVAGVFGARAVKQMAEYADELIKVSRTTGLAFSEFQRLQHGLTQQGVSAGAAQKAFARLSTTINTAMISGTKESIARFTMLGLNFDSLVAKSPEARFLDVVDALSAMEDKSRSAALAQQLLGKQFGLARIEADTLRAEGAKIVTITTEAAETSERFNDALASLSTTLKNEIINAGAPALQFFADLADRLRESRKAANDLKTALTAPAGNDADSITARIATLDAEIAALEGRRATTRGVARGAIDRDLLAARAKRAQLADERQRLGRRTLHGAEGTAATRQRAGYAEYYGSRRQGVLLDRVEADFAPPAAAAAGGGGLSSAVEDWLSDPDNGIQTGWRLWAEANLAEITTGMAGDFVTSFSDSLTDGIIEGDSAKKIWRNLGNSIARTIARSAAESLTEDVAGLLVTGAKTALGFSDGGVVPMVPGARRGRDSVPAMLTPGEVVIPEGRARRGGFGSVYNIHVAAYGDLDDSVVGSIGRRIADVIPLVSSGQAEGAYD